MTHGQGARTCHLCSGDFAVDGAGIAQHLLGAEGGIDHAADGDHVPYELDD